MTEDVSFAKLRELAVKAEAALTYMGLVADYRETYDAAKMAQAHHDLAMLKTALTPAVVIALVDKAMEKTSDDKWVLVKDAPAAWEDGRRILLSYPPPFAGAQRSVSITELSGGFSRAERHCVGIYALDYDALIPPIPSPKDGEA